MGERMSSDARQARRWTGPLLACSIGLTLVVAGDPIDAQTTPDDEGTRTGQFEISAVPDGVIGLEEQAVVDQLIVKALPEQLGAIVSALADSSTPVTSTSPMAMGYQLVTLGSPVTVAEAERIAASLVADGLATTVESDPSSTPLNFTPNDEGYAKPFRGDTADQWSLSGERTPTSAKFGAEFFTSPALTMGGNQIDDAWELTRGPHRSWSRYSTPASSLTPTSTDVWSTGAT